MRERDEKACLAQQSKSREGSGRSPAFPDGGNDAGLRS